MKHFGIIGYPLQHSQSAVLFSEKFRREGIDAEYSLYPIARIDEFTELIDRVEFTGVNVTMPYKQQVIPFLSALDESAAAIGAVNVIRFRRDAEDRQHLTGFNTDALGFMESIRPLLRPEDRKALVLGTGGAAKAVRYGLEKLGLQVDMVSRSVERGLTYEQLDNVCISEHTVVVNCTPLGMVPDVEACPPFPFEWLTPQYLVYDVIYNPAETRFMHEARLRGCRVQGGQGMLLGQARAAWQIWNA